MSDKSSLIITANDVTTGKAQQKTVTDINPQASNQHLRTWAQMTAALTKDTYVKSKRVTVQELDVVKTARAGTVTAGSAAGQAVNGNNVVPLTFNLTTGTGNQLIIAYQSRIDAGYEFTRVSWEGDAVTDYIAWYSEHNPASGNFKGKAIVAISVDNSQPQTVSGVLHVYESESYASLDIPVTVIITEAEEG